MTRKRAVLWVGAVLLLSGCASVAPPPARPVVSDYPCRFTAQPLSIDGVMDEEAWSKAPVLNFMVPRTFKSTVAATEARMLYDNRYLYIGFKAHDRDIWGVTRERDGCTYFEDVLEAFLMTDVAAPAYCEFEVTPIGTVYDAYTPKWRAASNIRRWTQWDCQGLRHGIKVHGTLGMWEDEDECWVLEIAIPLKELPKWEGGRPAAGSKWRFHLARANYSVHLPAGLELSSTAPLAAPDFHRTQDWTTLVFE